MSDFQGIAERLGGFRRVLLCEFRHCTSHVINYWVTNLAAICLERCVHVAECNRRNFVTVLRPVAMESPSISAFVVSERMGATDAERSLGWGEAGWWNDGWARTQHCSERAARRMTRELPQLIDDDAVQSCRRERFTVNVVVISRSPAAAATMSTTTKLTYTQELWVSCTTTTTTATTTTTITTIVLYNNNNNNNKNDYYDY